MIYNVFKGRGGDRDCLLGIVNEPTFDAAQRAAIERYGIERGESRRVWIEPCATAIQAMIEGQKVQVFH